MPKLKNSRWEKFAQRIFAGDNGSEAGLAAGYSSKTVGAAASRLLKNVKVKARIGELFKKTENSAILTKQQLAEMYSRMAKVNLTDFIELDQDGRAFVRVTKEMAGSEALKKVKFVEKIDEQGNVVMAIQFTDLEIESKVAVGQALSKLMGYEMPDTPNVNLNITIGLPEKEGD